MAHNGPVGHHDSSYPAGLLHYSIKRNRRVVNVARKISKKESLDGCERNYRIDLAHIVVAAAYVLARHALEKSRVPIRQLLNAHVGDGIANVWCQLSLEPASIVHILMETDNP